MIGAIGSFFQVAAQVGQAIHAAQRLLGQDGEDGQEAAAGTNAQAGNAVERTVEINGTDGRRVVVTKITRPDGRVTTRRDATGAGESFSSILAAVGGRGAATADRGTAELRQGASAQRVAAGRVDLSI